MKILILSAPRAMESNKPAHTATLQEENFQKKENCINTFKLESSFPARAKSNVDFPEPGGPKSNVILFPCQT